MGKKQKFSKKQVKFLKSIKFRKVNVEEISKFLTYLSESMNMATECLVMMYIYLKKLMGDEKVQLRQCNWRPLVFIAYLTASKFYEEIK